MDAVDGVVPEAVWAERTAVANAVPEDAPGISRLIPIVPGDPGHFTVMPGLGLAYAESGGRYNFQKPYFKKLTGDHW